MDRRTFLTAGAVSSLTALTAPSIPAHAATTDPLKITAGFLSMGLSATGTVTSLVDLRDGTDHLAAGKSVPLVSVVVDGQHEVPTALRTAPGVLVFSSGKVTIEVKVVTHPTYTTFEVTKLTAATGADVQTLLWGPLPTNVTETIGQTVGVIRNDTFAFGMRPVNDKTVGGWPNEHLAYGFGPDIVWNPYGLQTGDDQEWLRNNVAAKTGWGSVLRAYTYDYSRTRIRRRTSGYQVALEPVPAQEGQIVGSKIALFGSAPDLALSVIGLIAGGEGLPYPTLDGQWQKAAQAASQSFFVLFDLNTETAATASRYAKQAGIGTIYAIAGDGPWKSHGHYEFNAAFGGSDTAAAKLVATARENGAEVGVHTLSDFIDTSDPYITPPPADERLAVGVPVKLTRPATASDTTLYVDANEPLGEGVAGKRLRIGDEFVTYSGITTAGGQEWQVTGVQRAQWGSSAQDHPTGTRATRIIQNGYGGAIGGLPIIDEIATRLATAYNATGITSTSYDGLESAAESGWGGYGFARLVNGVYRRLKSVDGFITEASNLCSNTWDAQSRVSWGEIGVTDYAQIKRSNTFYRANYLPGMMGWLGVSGSDSLLKVEATMARAASLDAGIGFETTVRSFETGSNAAAVLDAVRTWESARRAGAFTAAQKTLLGDPATNWHLTVVTPDRTWSLQQLDAEGKPVGAPQTVEAPEPGFSNPQPPEARIGKLYEFKITSRSPLTTRYDITSGTLPAGLTLHRDTGAVTGVPTKPGARRFTITARGGTDASITYTLKVTV
ncbi:Ig domain-containing protein [Nonomuraea sp. NPDC050536]|uniref:Ig domain-containing protein n=1 Tax=Nonomuraea sp. NPDC050536 TaxID=3364366 RepID=UPI0037C8CF3E